jgi:4-amino-4-deoxy-L-arabinose transferase-like glycosyltransferase
VIIAGALLLRLGFVATQPDYRPAADAQSFDQTAVTLAVHGEYPSSTIAPSGGPTAYRPPGYPYVLAALYRLTGTATSSSRFVVARVLSALFGTGIVGLIGLIAWMLWGWGAPMLTAMGLATVYPPLVTIGDSMLAEPLFGLLVLSAVAATLMARRGHHRLRWAALVGGLLGLAVLARTNGIILVLPLTAGVWAQPRLTRASLSGVGALLVVALLVLTPWAVRNALAFHQFVPLTTQAGFTLAGRYNGVSFRTPDADWRVPSMAPYNTFVRAHESEARIEQRFRSYALRFMEGHPAYVLKVGYFNLGRLLGTEGPSFERDGAAERGLGLRSSDLDVYSFYVLAGLAAAALGLGAIRAAPAFLWGVPLAIAASLVFITADMRYRFPIDPFLILLVAGAIAARMTADRSAE